jgi:hypothetical protein
MAKKKSKKHKKCKNCGCGGTTSTTGIDKNTGYEDPLKGYPYNESVKTKGFTEWISNNYNK